MKRKLLCVASLSLSLLLLGGCANSASTSIKESTQPEQFSATVVSSSATDAKEDLTALYDSIVSELNVILEKYHKGELPKPFFLDRKCLCL